MEARGADAKEMGLNEFMEEDYMKDFPTYEDYVGLRDMVTGYTGGHLMVTSWRWNTADVKPGQSAGLCVGDQDDATGAYWSCWEYKMREDGGWDDMPKAYLINPKEFNKDSRLHDYRDLNAEAFPGMLGGWLCFPPMDVLMNSYTDCMRFLPKESKPEDYRFGTGPVRVMTYLTSRADRETVLVEGNETMQ